MDIRTALTAEDIAGIVKLASDATYGGNLTTSKCELVRTNKAGMNTVRIVLKVRRSDEKGAHYSPSGRRTVAACWHCYRDVLHTLFDTDPSAVASSGLARYNGKADFIATFPRTFYRNTGSVARPIEYGKLCACGKSPEIALADIRNRPYASGYSHLARFAG